MRNEEIIEKCYEHKHALIFAAGIATTIIAKKALESKTVKNAATRGMASILSAKKDAEECFQDMKQNAEEIVIDSHNEDKKQIYAQTEN